MKTNAYEVHRVLSLSFSRGDGAIFPKKLSWEGTWTKFGFLEGGRGTTQLGDTCNFQGGGRTGKKGLEPWKKLCSCVSAWKFPIRNATNSCRRIMTHAEREGRSTYESTFAYSEGGTVKNFQFFAQVINECPPIRLFSSFSVDGSQMKGMNVQSQ